jgi:hypothetical protein
MPKYAVELRRTGNIATIGQLTASSAIQARRGKLIDLVIACDDAAGDASFVNQVQRVTTVGTATPIIPAPVDPADAAALTVANNLHTVDPTYTAATVLLSIAMNQRTTMHWIAPPGGELIWPATNLNGLGVRQRAASALTHTASCEFEE